MQESRYNVWQIRGDCAYVYNGVSGALLRVPAADVSELQRFLADGAPDACRMDLLQQMTRGRMLVADDADEIGMLEKRYAASRSSKDSFALTIVTSLGCDFDCPYCFEAKHPSVMREDVQRAVLRVLDDQLPKIRDFAVTWFGGEPLVGKKALLALSDAFIERTQRAGVNYFAHITTNGYQLDESTCRQLKDRRVTSAQVCLDGPPEIHDRMRPLANGKGTFWRIISNLHHAVEYLDVSIRMNVDAENIAHAGALFEILSNEGFAGKLTVYPGQIVGMNREKDAPSATYGHRCLASPSFARAERTFNELAKTFGLAAEETLPRPTGAPCTAVRANELVVGSRGELYKCWDTVGHKTEVIGHIDDYQRANGRIEKWLKYNPFQDDECRTCVALPVCMGGCAHHAMDALQYENRCATFRHTYDEQVAAFVEAAEARGVTTPYRREALPQRMDTR